MSNSLGQAFRIEADLSPADAKRALCSDLLNPFGTRPGFHGGFVGSVFLLFWRPTAISHGHVLIGRIVAQGAGSRVSGRSSIAIVQTLSGWALLALVSYCLIFPMALASDESASFWPILVQAPALIAVGYALAVWIGGFDPSNADSPLGYVQSKLRK